MSWKNRQSGVNAPRGGRGGRGGGGGSSGGGREGANQNAQERPRKDSILDLTKYQDKKIRIKFAGGREGVLQF